MVFLMGPLGRRAEEDWLACIKCKRRTTRAKIPRYLVCSVAQKRRFTTFVGHVARLDEIRRARKVMSHRSLGVWRMAPAETQDTHCDTADGVSVHVGGRSRYVDEVVQGAPRNHNLLLEEAIPADWWEAAQGGGHKWC